MHLYVLGFFTTISLSSDIIHSFLLELYENADNIKLIFQIFPITLTMKILFCILQNKVFWDILCFLPDLL